MRSVVQNSHLGRTDETLCERQRRNDDSLRTNLSRDLNRSLVMSVIRVAQRKNPAGVGNNHSGQSLARS